MIRLLKISLAGLLALAISAITVNVVFQSGEHELSDKEALEHGADVSEMRYEKAKRLYYLNCAVCHGTNLDGKGERLLEPVPSLLSKEYRHGVSDEDVFRIIAEGSQDKGMMPFADKLSSEEIEMLVLYLKSEREAYNSEDFSERVDN